MSAEEEPSTETPPEGADDLAVSDERALAEDRPASATGRSRDVVSRLAIGALVFTLLYAGVLAMLAGDGRGGLVRLLSEAPGSSGWILLGAYVVALAATVGLGLYALARGSATSIAAIPSFLLLAGGGVLSALAAHEGAAKVLRAAPGAKSVLVRTALSHAAMPRVIALAGAGMLIGLTTLVGLVRLYQVDLPSKRRWGPFVALLLAVFLGASLPLTYASLSISVSAMSLVPLASAHYFALAALAFALPRALRLRDAGEGELAPVRALLLTCLCGPLGTIVAWQASVAAARSAPLVENGRPLTEALTFLGPQAVGVTIAAAALVALSAGNAIGKAIVPRAPAIAAFVALLAAAGTYVWSAVIESGLR